MNEIYNTLIKEINEKYGFFSDSDGELVTFKENKSGKSFYLGSNTIIVLKDTSQAQRILIKKSLFDKDHVVFTEAVSYRYVHLKSEPLYVIIEVPLNHDVSSFIKPYIEKAISNYRPPKTFACCHLYVQCSDAGKCLHPKQIYAKQCWYRDNLESGKIFYGNNQT